ncbi:MAG: benzoyl-CoA 2,3-epoxidase subunit [Acidobacteriota bacterium]|jgi:1,2-phenylacetyl-CoA epoxidase catalytic subunit|nr:benzoyl-CoA 2,3-epoxidase subunit [Acidobacteriota bacterium]
MSVKTSTLPKRYHEAVLKWKEVFLPDYDFLMENWDKHFPNDPEFQLCAYRELGMCTEIECGDLKGKPKAQKPSDMLPEQAHHLFGAIRAQASTEFGSIQQHRLTLARAQEEEEQFWILRMMAEELRHGYQMLHLLVEDDWSSVSKESASDVFEDILSMTTGSHLLGAFNIDFDSFVDNVVFCALIDRVGKYQLAMQKISAYQPMAESMPQMLREEAFHLAAGVVPMRRWVMGAARGETFVTMEVLQKAINKWLPRGLEMFGDERGGGTNVRLGLKPMKNSEAQRQYYDEVAKLVRDLNLRYLRARVADLTHAGSEAAFDRILAGETVEGVRREDLLHIPHMDFFRRRGVPSFRMVGDQGETFATVPEYLQHLVCTLPESYRASRDYKEYVQALTEVQEGRMTAEQAAGKMPALRRVAGACPCSKSVRWMVDEPSLIPAVTAESQPAVGQPVA